MFFSTPSSPPKYQISEKLNQAKEFVAQKQFAQAVSLYKELSLECQKTQRFDGLCEVEFALGELIFNGRGGVSEKDRILRAREAYIKAHVAFRKLYVSNKNTAKLLYPTFLTLHSRLTQLPKPKDNLVQYHEYLAGSILLAIKIHQQNADELFAKAKDCPKGDKKQALEYYTLALESYEAALGWFTVYHLSKYPPLTLETYTQQIIIRDNMAAIFLEEAKLVNDENVRDQLLNATANHCMGTLISCYPHRRCTTRYYSGLAHYALEKFDLAKADLIAASAKDFHDTPAFQKHAVDIYKALGAVYDKLGQAQQSIDSFFVSEDWKERIEEENKKQQVMQVAVNQNNNNFILPNSIETCIKHANDASDCLRGRSLATDEDAMRWNEKARVSYQFALEAYREAKKTNPTSINQLYDQLFAIHLGILDVCAHSESRFEMYDLKLRVTIELVCSYQSRADLHARRQDYAKSDFYYTSADDLLQKYIDTFSQSQLAQIALIYSNWAAMLLLQLKASKDTQECPALIDKIIKTSLQAITLCNISCFPYYILGQAYFIKSKFSLAVECYNTALLENFSQAANFSLHAVNIYRSLGEAYSKLNKVSEAQSAHQEAEKWRKNTTSQAYSAMPKAVLFSNPSNQGNSSQATTNSSSMTQNKFG